VIEELVRSAAKHLGYAAGSLVNLLTPDLILLGGGLVEALPELYHEEVLNAARKQAMPCYRETFNVAVAELEDYAAVKGAAAWAQHVLARRAE